MVTETIIIKPEKMKIEKEEDSKPLYPPLNINEQPVPNKGEFRIIKVANNRRNPLKKNWQEMCKPIIDNLKLQIRMNIFKGQVELRTSEHTESISALQKGADFVKAVVLGFDIKDALAMLRLNDIYLDSFMVTDVKKLPRNHLSRAIGRLVGTKGKTKNSIENATQTRILIADKHIHILGSFKNIRVAKTTLVRLIVGSQPSKVYSQMQAVCSRNKYRI